ncbi:MAG: phosphoribosyltransferase, partial [Stackebrandtia sp.]
MVFQDRRQAGRELAAELRRRHYEHPVVLGLPRGGVPVAAEVARELKAPLDVIVVRKLGVPGMPEVAIGAIGEDGSRVLDRHTMREAQVSDRDLDQVTTRERAALDKRVTRLRGDHRQVPLREATAIIVDVGVATGSTARAACDVARERGASTVVLAVPVAPDDVVSRLARAADEVVCVQQPEFFSAVGEWYVNFGQTSDTEVLR